MISDLDSGAQRVAHLGEIATIDGLRLPAACVADSFVTRRVPPTAHWELTRSVTPRAGDLVVARVDDVIQHSVIELRSGRKQVLYPGRLLLLAYGNRYAPDQFEAVVPADLGPCHLVSSGGIAGCVVSAHDSMSRPTTLDPLGIVIDGSGRPVNLSAFGLADAAPMASVRAAGRPPVVAVLGSSMNAGKTECAVRLVRRCIDLGLRVAAAKVTGTGAGNDLWRLSDAGAQPVFDFTDAGYATTSCLRRQQVVAIALKLVAQLALAEPDVIVIEVSDGVLQPETSALMASPRFRSMVDGVVFAGSDALGTVAGIDRLQRSGFDVIGASGTMSQSPLARREVELSTAVATYTAEELADPSVSLRLPTRRRRAGRLAAR